MPKKECCCGPRPLKKTHVAVLCRYYGKHTVYSLNDRVTSGSVGFGAPSGFESVTFGAQRIFGSTSQIPAFGNDQTTLQIRGPVFWDVIKTFDTSRDVVLLSRSGGGSSQLDNRIDGPKGGNSALIQNRIKANLQTEVIVGTGGYDLIYDGGHATRIGINLNQPNSDAYVTVGAGGGAGKQYKGGNGGVTNGFSGEGDPFSGGGGSQTQGGSAGGPNAGTGGILYGGTGGFQGGGGGDGKWAGGGGDQRAGGGGGASDVGPALSGFFDIIYNEDGSSTGPGGVCDPFISYYTNVINSSNKHHAGIGGGANIIYSTDDANINSTTNLLGFGVDYNIYKTGMPGILTAVWLDKYCPCSENLETSENQSKVLPEKMYICLTDVQYQVLVDWANTNGPLLNSKHLKFEIDGETYIYFGNCINAECHPNRSVIGNPQNIRETDIPDTFNEQVETGLYSDCCDTIICQKVCQIPSASCLKCRCDTASCINTTDTLKYCCLDVDSKPNEYYSIKGGWLWLCRKRKYFWYPFGIKPEYGLPPTHEHVWEGVLYREPLTRECFPVTLDTSTATQSELNDFVRETCDVFNGNCTPYVGFMESNPDHPCRTNIGFDEWGGKMNWPVTMTASICGLGNELIPNYGFSTEDICNLQPVSEPYCSYRGCPENPDEITINFTECEQVKYSGCDDGFISHNSPPNTKKVRAVKEYYALTLPSSCKEVLGFTIKIPRCHPDPANPLITDPLKYQDSPIPIIRVSSSTTPPLSPLRPALVETCDKGVYGWGTLSDFLNTLKNTTELDIEITVENGNLWLSHRPHFDECTNERIYSPPDVFSRKEYTEFLDYRLIKYYFSPIGYIFQVRGNVNDESRMVRKKHGIQQSSCDCGIQNDEISSFPAKTSFYAYFSEPYYLYENPSGTPPTLLRGNFVPAFPGANSGFSEPPNSIITNFPCAEALGLKDFVARSYAPCEKITYDYSDFPPNCNTNVNYIENYCIGNFLTITW